MTELTISLVQSHEGCPEVSEPYHESKDCLIKTIYDSYHVARWRKSVLGPSFWWPNGSAVPYQTHEVMWWGEICD